MDYELEFDLEVSGLPVAPISGTARIEALHGAPGHWHVASIRLDTSRGRIGSVELTEPWLYTRIAYHLLTARRVEIEAEWREHEARQIARVA